MRGSVRGLMAFDRKGGAGLQRRPWTVCPGREVPRHQGGSVAGWITGGRKARLWASGSSAGRGVQPAGRLSPGEAEAAVPGAESPGGLFRSAGGTARPSLASHAQSVSAGGLLRVRLSVHWPATCAPSLPSRQNVTGTTMAGTCIKSVKTGMLLHGFRGQV